MARQLRARSRNISIYDSDHIDYYIVDRNIEYTAQGNEKKNKEYKEDERAKKIEELWKEWLEIKTWLESSARLLEIVEKKVHGLTVKIGKIRKKVQHNIKDVRELNSRTEKLLEITEREIKPIKEWIEQIRKVRSAIGKIRDCVKNRLIVEIPSEEEESKMTTEEYLEMLRKLRQEIASLRYEKEKKIKLRSSQRTLWITIAKEIAKICIELENVNDTIKVKNYFDSSINTEILFDILVSRKKYIDTTIDDAINIVMEEIYIENLP